MKQRLKSNIILLIAAVIWGFAFVAQTLGSDSGIPSFTFISIRFIIGGIVLIPIILIFERKNLCSNFKTMIIGALVSGTFLFLASVTQQEGIALTSNPALAGFITSLYTIFTPIAYFILYKRKTVWNAWVGIVLGIIGLYLLCSNGNAMPTFGKGEIFLLLCALLWMAQILTVDKYVSLVDPITFSSCQFIVCGILAAVAALIFDRSTFSFQSILDGKWSLLYCGLLSSGVGFTLQSIGQKGSSPTDCAIIMSLESVFAALGGVLWNIIAPSIYHVDQDLGVVGYIGCMVIFCGVILSQLDFTSISKTRQRRR